MERLPDSKVVDTTHELVQLSRQYFGDMVRVVNAQGEVLHEPKPPQAQDEISTATDLAA